MKIVSVVGARPNFIKLAPLSRELRKNHQEIIIHTGQHYDYGMSERFFKELEIPEPDYNLGVGSGNQGEQLGEMMIRLEKPMIKENPDMVMVFGDTNSTLAGALVAARHDIGVAHVEAGLRSGDITMPEEQNRIFVDILSSILFCPTGTAIHNLRTEGRTGGVFFVGNLMIEMLDKIRGIAEQSTVVTDLGLEPYNYIVATVHRASNTDIRINLSNILQAFGMIEYDILFPIHPRTKKAIESFGLDIPGNVKVSDPLGYFDMIKAMATSFKIITDSGGIQKEASYLDIPCVTLRETTEWPETMEYGWNVLVGTNPEWIYEAVMHTPSTRPHFLREEKMEPSKEIVAIIDNITGIMKNNGEMEEAIHD